MAEKKRNRKDDEGLLKEIRDRFQAASTYWRDIRTEASTDMRYVAGDPFTEEDRKQRGDRPLIAPDEMGQYFNQVINDLRANKRAMKFSPDADGANEDSAAFYADKAREIEYRSKAQMAYITAAENAIQRSYGWVRIKTKYESDRSFNQDLWIEPIPNPDLVLIDPESLKPDASDMKWAFVFERIDTEEFKRLYPKAQVRDFSNDDAIAAPQWLDADLRKVQIAEYWKVKTTKKRLLLVQPPPPMRPAGQMLDLRMMAPQKPIDVFEDELGKIPEGATILRDREVEVPSVCQYLTNGVEILAETEWPGKYIPFVSCYGKVIFVDEGSGTKRKILSMTRAMRGPWKFYCYIRSQQMEMAGMIPKVPVVGYTGQFAGVEHDWQKAPHEPMAFIEANAVTEATGSTVLPLPQRIPYSPGEHLAALELLAEAARRAIQAAAGSNFLPTQAQRRNEKSGVALEKMDQAAAKGTFHFVDHYNDMVTHVAVIVEDLMDKVLDTARDTGIRKDDESAQIVRINDTQLAKGQEKPITTKGSHGVTVSTGPSADSSRDAVQNFMETLAGTEMAPQVMDLLVRLRAPELGGGPVLDELAERLTPPQFKKPKDGEKDAQQLSQELAQMQGQFQELVAVADGMKKAIETDQAKQQATIEKAKIDADKDLLIARERNATTIAVAHIAAAAKGMAIDAHAAEEAQALGHASEQADLDRAHQVATGAQQQADSLEAGDVSHRQAMEQGEQGQAHALEQMAATPPPTGAAS